MSETVITELTLDSLRDHLQQAGYRVEKLTDPVANIQYLRSATAGVGFDIRPGNRLPAADESFADLAFVLVLQVAGDLPLDLVNRWNAARRFGRLHLSPPFLVFCLDISVINGVAPAHLRSQIELWDRLLQDLRPFLRTAIAEAAIQNNKSAAQPVTEPRADQPPPIASLN
jgi:Putative bacterial sensory transduction regulator